MDEELEGILGRAFASAPGCDIDVALSILEVELLRIITPHQQHGKVGEVLTHEAVPIDTLRTMPHVLDAIQARQAIYLLRGMIPLMPDPVAISTAMEGAMHLGSLLERLGIRPLEAFIESGKRFKKGNQNSHAANFGSPAQQEAFGDKVYETVMARIAGSKRSPHDVCRNDLDGMKGPVGKRLSGLTIYGYFCRAKRRRQNAQRI